MSAQTKPVDTDRLAALDLEDLGLQDMIASIANKNEPAIAAFYNMTISRVYATALRITMRPDAAEEVVGDVYLQVWQQANRFDAARGRVLTWLLTICRSRALDHLRRKDRAELHAEPHTLRPDLQLDENDPQNLLLALERKSSVYAAVARLNSTQQQLVALAFFKGLSHQEISDYVAMPLGTVKSHIRKALSILQQALGTNPKSDSEFP